MHTRHTYISPHTHVYAYVRVYSYVIYSRLIILQNISCMTLFRGTVMATLTRAVGVTVNHAEHSIWSWPGVTAGFKKHHVVFSQYFTGLIAVKGHQSLYPKCCDLISHSSNRSYKHTNYFEPLWLTTIYYICSILIKNSCMQRGRHRVAQGSLVNTGTLLHTRIIFQSWMFLTKFEYQSNSWL